MDFARLARNSIHGRDGIEANNLGRPHVLDRADQILNYRCPMCDRFLEKLDRSCKSLDRSCENHDRSLKKLDRCSKLPDRCSKLCDRSYKNHDCSCKNLDRCSKLPDRWTADPDRSPFIVGLTHHLPQIFQTLPRSDRVGMLISQKLLISF